MKIRLIAVTALVACLAVAMPTNDELEKANKFFNAKIDNQAGAAYTGRLE